MPEATAKGRAKARPLSPHLQIYRWPVTMGTSILHRITGVGLAGGTLLLAWWLHAVSEGPEAYAFFLSIAGHVLGQFVLFGFTLALVYHAFNGMRHLFWDAGVGFDLKTANRSGLFVYAATLLTTLGIWVLAHQSMGVWS